MIVLCQLSKENSYVVLKRIQNWMTNKFLLRAVSSTSNIYANILLLYTERWYSRFNEFTQLNLFLIFRFLSYLLLLKLLLVTLIFLCPIRFCLFICFFCLLSFKMFVVSSIYINWFTVMHELSCNSLTLLWLWLFLYQMVMAILNLMTILM